MVDPVSYVKMFFRSVSPSSPPAPRSSGRTTSPTPSPFTTLASSSTAASETYVTFSIYAQAYSAEARKQLEGLSAGTFRALLRVRMFSWFKRGGLRVW